MIAATNPQNWNTYSYGLNSSVNASDPSGLLTIYVPGTNYNKSDTMDSHIASSLNLTFGEKAKFFNWEINGKPGPNDSGLRSLAAAALAYAINNYGFAEGEKLNIVAHSHGGNVVMEATHLLNRAVDQLVTFATPVTSSYQPKTGTVKHHVAISNTNDLVQISGNNTSSLTNIGRSIGSWFGIPKVGQLAGSVAAKILGGNEAGFAGRKFEYMPNIVNKDASGYISNGLFKSHSQSWQSQRVWSELVVPNLNK